MKPIKYIVRGFFLVTSAALWSGSASALWMGLGDGDYNITLSTCIGDAAVCATIPTTGQMTVSGEGLSFLNITIDGVTFTGDPIDAVVPDFFGTPGDIRERGIVNQIPTSGFSLLHAIGPEIHPFVPQVNSWAYCQNIPNSSDSCTPSGAGEWVATPSAVPEPTSLLLTVIGLACLRKQKRLLGFRSLMTTLWTTKVLALTSQDSGFAQPTRANS